MRPPDGNGGRGYVYACGVRMPKRVSRNRTLRPNHSYYQVHTPEQYWDWWNMYQLQHGQWVLTKAFDNGIPVQVPNTI